MTAFRIYVSEDLGNWLQTAKGGSRAWFGVSLREAWIVGAKLRARLRGVSSHRGFVSISGRLAVRCSAQSGQKGLGATGSPSGPICSAIACPFEQITIHSPDCDKLAARAIGPLVNVNTITRSVVNMGRSKAMTHDLA